MIKEPVTISNLKHIYFIGIGGIGMSAIARYFHAQGKKVSGYDKTATSLTRTLEAEGIPVHYEDDWQLAPKDADWVIYTPAVPTDHQELTAYQKGGYALMKRSEVLQVITESSFNICVAGTHGKTTTSTMIAHLLRDSGYGCNAFLGGISANYQTNFWSDPRNVCVIEADEYDRSFLKLSPDVAIVTAMDPDHLDIYETAENVKQAFIDFSKRLKPGGLLIRKFGMDRSLKSNRSWEYSLQNDTADVYGSDIQMKDGGYVFNVHTPLETIESISLPMGGMHNVENMIAAIAVASSLHIDSEKIKAAVASFRGVKRRFEYVIKTPQQVFIDDYAHHPEELKALINGVKTLFPQRKFTLIFQPHLYSRTRDFAADFAEVLSAVDQVILLPIYPAREQPIAGVDSALIAGLIKDRSVAVMSREQLLNWVQTTYLTNRDATFGSILVTAGAGDIDKLVAPIKNSLTNYSE